MFAQQGLGLPAHGLIALLYPVHRSGFQRCTQSDIANRAGSAKPDTSVQFRDAMSSTHMLDGKTVVGCRADCHIAT